MTHLFEFIPSVETNCLCQTITRVINTFIEVTVPNPPAPPVNSFSVPLNTIHAKLDRLSPKTLIKVALADVPDSASTMDKQFQKEALMRARIAGLPPLPKAKLRSLIANYTYDLRLLIECFS